MTGFEPGPLMLEATALPTVPLPRFDPYYFNISFLFFFNFSVYQRKSMINFIETVCQEKKINLLVSQILNSKLTYNLESNKYKILKEEWDTDVNAVKIFDNLGNGDGKKKKSKKRSKKKKRSRKI